MAKKTSTPKPEESSDKTLQAVVAFISLIKNVGILGLIVGTIAYFAIWVASPEQQSAMVDRYLLFRGESGHELCIAAVTALAVANVITIAFFKKLLKVEQDTVVRLNNWIEQKERIVQK